MANIIEPKKTYKTFLYVETEQEKCYISESSLSDFLESKIKTSNDIANISNFFLKGFCGLGKTTVLSQAFIKLKKNGINCIWFSLHCFNEKISLREIVKDNLIKNDGDQEKFGIIFMDSLNEISDKNKITLGSEISQIRNEFPNIKFIISGRDSDFIQEFSKKFYGTVEDLRLIKCDSSIDPSLYQLEKKYEGKSYSNLVSIPLYRVYFEELENQSNPFATTKEFYTAFIESQLENDKIMIDTSKGISSRQAEKNFGSLKSKIARLCALKFYRKESTVFTESELKNFSEREKEIFLNSSLVGQQDGATYILLSSFFFEYFVALYLSSNDLFFSTLKNIFFLKKQNEINVKNLNLLSVLLSIMSEDKSKCRNYGKLIKKLDSISPLFVLQADHTMFADEIRYEYFNRIVSERNSKKLWIYYGTFYNSNDFVNNIKNLSGVLLDLLPKSKYSDFLNQAKKSINNYIDTKNENSLHGFINYATLLGIYQEKQYWNEGQQEVVKQLVDKLVLFFRDNGIPIFVQGALSVGAFLELYKRYNWAKNWSESDWINFLSKFVEIENDLSCKIKTKQEFDFKICIFNLFHADTNIAKMLCPILLYIFEEKPYQSFDYKHCTAPIELDDDYNPPSVSINLELEILKNIAENYFLPATEELIDLFYEFSKNKIILSVDSIGPEHEILNIIFKQFFRNLKIVNAEYFEKLSAAIIYIFEYEPMRIDEKKIDGLSSEAKLFVLNTIYTKLKNSTQLKNPWGLWKILVPLLNVDDTSRVSQLLIKISEFKGIYADIIFILCSEKESGHPLHDYAIKIFETNDDFANARIIKGKKIKNLELFEKAKVEMLKHEAYVLSEKETLIDEVNRVYEFLDGSESRNFPDYDDSVTVTAISPTYNTENSERMKLIYLRTESIKSSIENDYRGTYRVPPVFSEYVIELLFKYSFNDSYVIDRQYVAYIIEKAFDYEKFYWRFFIDTYLEYLDSEKRVKFFADNPEVRNRFLRSMEREIKERTNSDTIDLYFTGKNKDWVVPFIKCLKLFAIEFSIDLKSLVNENIINLLVFPTILINGMQMNVDFDIKGTGSIPYILNNFFGILYNIILKYCFDNYSLIDNDTAKAQLLSYAFEICSNHTESLSNKEVAEKEIQKIFFDETESLVQQEYEDYQDITMLNRSAGEIWRLIDSDFECIKKAESLITKDFLIKYYDGVNVCVREVGDYFLKFADSSTKEFVIKKLLKQKHIPEVCRFLCTLGEPSSQCKIIKDYLNGKKVGEYFTSSFQPFGFLKSNNKVLKKWLDLFDYSLEGSSMRRQILLQMAMKGIREHSTEYNYRIVESFFTKIIVKRNKQNLANDIVNDFLNEIKQKTGERKRKGMLVTKTNIIILSIVACLTGLFVYSWDSECVAAKILLALFTLVSGFASILSFLDYTPKSLILKYKE